MLERIKSLFGNIKDFVVFILVPVSFVAGYIAYLLGQNRDLSNKIGNKEEEDNFKKLNEFFKEKKDELYEQNKRATDAESNYKSVRDKYLGQTSDVPGSDKGGGSSTDGEE